MNLAQNVAIQKILSNNILNKLQKKKTITLLKVIKN